MLYIKRLPTAALALLPLAITAAITTTASAETSPLVVTATRMAQTIDQSLVPVSVITREQIERSPATSLPELLGQLPGVDFSMSGGHGKQSSLYLRGTSSTHVLVLIDGVRAGSATLGSFPFEQIPVSQIERIEVVRGPRSSLYGAEAIGGVIQIFTRKGTQGISANARLGLGNHGSQDLQVGVGVGDERTQLSLSVGQYQTDGINGLAGANPDKDGYESRSISANASHQVTDRVKADLTILHANSESHYDSQAAPADDYSDNVQQTLGLRLSAEVNDEWSLSGGVNQHRDESENFDAFPGSVDTKRQGADIKSDHYLSENDLLTLGLDYYDEQVVKTGGNYDETSRYNKALYGQWQGQMGVFSILAGLRHDDNEAYGTHNTGNINIGIQVAPKHRLLASYGTAFKAPSFNDLYWPGFGNPNLKPEDSTTYELGYEGEAKRLGYAVRTFHTEVDNLISVQPSNQQARIRGVELELSTDMAGWHAAANASFLDSVDRTTGNRLANRAERTLQLDLSRRYASLDWMLSFLAQGDRISQGKKLAGYGLLNLKTRYAIDPHFGIEVKVANLLDKDYTTNSDFLGRTYSGLDRTYLVSLTYNR